MPRALPKSIATVALSGTLTDKLDAAARAGFDGVEIMEHDLLTFDGRPEEVRRIAGDLGLAIFVYQPFRDFEAMPEPQRARNLVRAERKFDVMQALGTDLVLVCSNAHRAALDDDARAAADLAEMAERAARRGLRVGYEALSWGQHVKLWRHAWKIVQQAHTPHSASSSTVSIRSRWTTIHPPWPKFPATASFSCNWPTRRASPWTSSPGAAISASFQGKAKWMSPASCAPCWPPVTPGRSRSRSLTTTSAPAPPA
jgi:hypothetical protein